MIKKFNQIEDEGGKWKPHFIGICKRFNTRLKEDHNEKKCIHAIQEHQQFY